MLHAVRQREIDQGPRDVGVLGAEVLLFDGQDALEDRERLLAFTLPRQAVGNRVERHRQRGVVGAEQLLVDFERASILVERPPKVAARKGQVGLGVDQVGHAKVPSGHLEPLVGELGHAPP